MKIEGKVFVVTGGASGLGEATCRLLVEKGGKVAIFDVGDDKGKALAAELGKHTTYIHCDVTKEDSVTAAIDSAMTQFGRIDGNVNCAGMGAASPMVNRKGKPIDMKLFEGIIRLNLLGSILVSSRCAVKMLDNEPSEDGERGCVIYVASIAAMDGQNGQAPYSAAKGGIVGMTLPLARDMGSRGIRVNSIAPGVFMTPPLEKGMKQKDGSWTRVAQSLMSQQVFPNKRFGHPRDFAHMVGAVFENVMVNGETIRLDAGTRMPKL